MTEAGVTQDEADKITHENAMRWYSFDPFAHVPREQASVGALRSAAEGHDVSIRSMSRWEKLTAEQVQARWQNMGQGAAGTGAQRAS